MGALQPRFAPTIRQVHRLVSEIPALRKEFSLSLAQQFHPTSLIKMCQSFNHLLAPYIYSDLLDQSEQHD